VRAIEGGSEPRFTEQKPAPQVTINTDGRCKPNPGLGTWGAVLRSGPHAGSLLGVVAEAQSTNQRAELTAAIQALSALKFPCDVTLESDSAYLIHTMRGSYRRKANLDLWEQLDAAAGLHNVAWVWCKGHAGNSDNERAHQLAELAASRVGAA